MGRKQRHNNWGEHRRGPVEIAETEREVLPEWKVDRDGTFRGK